MDIRFERTQLADGFEESRRYENGTLVTIVRHRTTPGGLSIQRRFSPDGKLEHESYSHGTRLMLTIDYVDGVKHAETYIGKDRLLTRTAYEKARAAVPDMPAADTTLVDHAEEARQWLRRERRAAKRKAAAPDPERARKNDAFCESLRAGDAVEDAFAWLESGPFRLGLMNVAASRRWMRKLRALGCPQAFACEVGRKRDGVASTGNLVVELPADAASRAKVLRQVNRVIQDQGFDPESDNGQRYCYVKFD
ncbi:MAG TPA: hypothetical protein VJ724_01485 [Tahibacter sp.]|nr:hypothetical protein [Tahibacter sp.]